MHGSCPSFSRTVLLSGSPDPVTLPVGWADLAILLELPLGASELPERLVHIAQEDGLEFSRREIRMTTLWLTDLDIPEGCEEVEVEIGFMGTLTKFRGNPRDIRAKLLPWLHKHGQVPYPQ